MQIQNTTNYVHISFSKVISDLSCDAIESYGPGVNSSGGNVLYTIEESVQKNSIYTLR